MTLQQAIEAQLSTNHKAFVPYIMAGDGGLETLKPTILKLQQLGVTAIEVGIPFTDPVADGPTIEEAGSRALAAGTTLTNVLETLQTFADEITVPLVAMTYLNPILAYGIEQFAKDAASARIQGLIVPDMPYEESELIHAPLKENKIALVQLVSLTSPKERIVKLATASEGFIYAVTVNGITGARSNFTDALPAHLAQLKELSNLPVLAGFGISTAEQVAQFSAMADGVIVGSKIVSSLQQNDWSTIEQLIAPTKNTVSTL
jgi:tryptophan synthase alpha chain